MSSSLHEQYLRKLSEANVAGMAFLSDGDREQLEKHRKHISEAHCLAQQIAGDPSQGIVISLYEG